MRLPPSLWPLLHRLANGRDWPPRDDAEAARFVGAATHEGLLPLLFDEEAPPAPVVAALARQRVWKRVFEGRARTLREALVGLPALLGAEPFVVLKGGDYAERLYPRPDLRTMQDIDILVPRERRAAVDARLREAGMTQLFPGSPTHHVPWFSESVFDLGQVTLEVHDSFLPRVRHAVDYRALWERRRPLTVDGLATSRLDDVDALVYHGLSLAKDEFFARLIRYVDLWLMLQAVPGALAPAVARAREWQTVHAFYGCLQQAQGFLPELQDVLAPALAELLPAARRPFFDGRVLPSVAERSVVVPRRRGVQLWRKFWLIDSLRRRAGFGIQFGYALAIGAWRGRGRPLGNVPKAVDLTRVAGENTPRSGVDREL